MISIILVTHFIGINTLMLWLSIENLTAKPAWPRLINNRWMEVPVIIGNVCTILSWILWSTVYIWARSSLFMSFKVRKKWKSFRTILLPGLIATALYLVLQSTAYKMVSNDDHEEAEPVS